MIDQNKIDILLKYIIITAGQEDDYYSRGLSPIHLIKYLYLADLEYSKQKDGKTFTGIPWKFYHYGPWSEIAYKRIEPALLSINADKKIIESKKYEDDFIRWTCQDDQLFNKLNENLPIIITGAIQKLVHQFGNDTTELLRYVYNTKPMLKAAPDEILDFIPGKIINENDTSAFEMLSCEKLSAKQEKKRKEQLMALKDHMRKRIEARAVKQRKAITPPRYDNLFFEGTEYLDSLVGEPVQPEELLLTFSDKVWKSKARFDPELS